MLSAHRYVAYTSDIGESFRPIAHPYLIKGAYAVSWIYLAGDVSHEGYKAYCRNQRVLHPEKFLEDEGEKKETKVVAVPGQDTGVFAQVSEAAKKATSTEGVKYGGAGTALTGGEVVAGRIPAIEDYRAVMAQRAVFQGLASMGLPAFTIHSIVRYSGRALKDAKNKTVRTWGPIGVSFKVKKTVKILMRNSLVLLLFHSFHTFLMSLSSMLRSGCSTMLSRHLVVIKLLKADR